MADNVKKTSELATTNSASGSDRLVIVKNPDTVPSTQTISVDHLFGNSSANISIKYLEPANSTITVNEGTVFYDNTYLYVAVANNTLKRVILESF